MLLSFMTEAEVLDWIRDIVAVDLEEKPPPSGRYFLAATAPITRRDMSSLTIPEAEVLSRDVHEIIQEGLTRKLQLAYEEGYGVAEQEYESARDRLEERNEELEGEVDRLKDRIHDLNRRLDEE